MDPAADSSTLTTPSAESLRKIERSPRDRGQEKRRDDLVPPATSAIAASESAMATRVRFALARVLAP